MGVRNIKQSAATLVAVALLAALTVIPLVGPASAQEASPASDTLVISPPVTERNVAPGEEFSYKLSLTNQATRDRAFTARANNAKPIGDEGGSDLVPEEGPYAIASWVTVNPATATIKQGEKLEVNVTVRVPQDAGPGSRFGGIVFTPTSLPGTSGPAVEVKAEISSLLLVTVAGPAKNELNLKSFDTNKTFYTDKDVNFTAIFNNQGNVVARPSGTITVKNLFGKEVHKMRVDPQRVLPTADRKFAMSWKSSGMLFGPYTATLDWSANGQGSSPTKIWFWGAPLNVLIPIAVALVLLFVLLWLPRKRLKAAAKAFKQNSGE